MHDEFAEFLVNERERKFKAAKSGKGKFGVIRLGDAGNREIVEQDRNSAGDAVTQVEQKGAQVRVWYLFIVATATPQICSLQNVN